MVKETGLYDELGISPDATESQIKSAYRKMALKYHPDKNNGEEAAAEKFKKVAEAYEILSDEQRRKQYDSFGMSGASSNAGPGGFPGGFGAGVDPMDIFASFFGGGGSQGRQPQKKKTIFILIELECSLEELRLGTSKTIELVRRVRCSACKGHGTANGREPPVCRGCKGSGTTTQVMMMGGMAMQQQVVCTQCNGKGRRVAASVCRKCGPPATTAKGEALPIGVMEERVKHTIRLPFAAEDGDTITLPGAGDYLPDSDVPGDVIIVVCELPHPFFHRINRFDLIVTNCKVPLGCIFTPGFTIPIEGLDGRVLLLSPPMREGGKPAFFFTSGHVFVVEGEGMCVKTNAPPQSAEEWQRCKKGKLYVPVEILFPAELTKKQIERIAAAFDCVDPGVATSGVKELSEYDGPSQSDFIIDKSGSTAGLRADVKASKRAKKATGADATRAKQKQEQQHQQAPRNPFQNLGGAGGPQVHVQQCNQQ